MSSIWQENRNVWSYDHPLVLDAPNHNLQAVGLKKEYLLVAIGAAIATVALSISGLLSWPLSVQQGADEGIDAPLRQLEINATIPTLGKTIEVPNSSMVTVYEGEKIFNSTTYGEPWLENNTSVFRSEIYDVSGYRYVSIFSEYLDKSDLPTMSGKTPEGKVPLEIVLTWSDPNTGLDMTMGARSEGGGFNQIFGPNLQILAYPSGWPSTAPLEDNSVPMSYVLSGNLTISMYLTS